MTRRLRTLICGLTTLLIMAGSLAPRQAASVRAMLPLGDDVRTDRDVALPDGFAATIDRATSDQFVRVVAGDVDQDGDIDVVASLGSLDLAVWQNDGAGHFTRLLSASHLAMRTQPPVPSVQDRSAASAEWIQNPPPRGAGLELTGVRTVEPPERRFTDSVILRHGRRGSSVRSSRAPPLV